MTSQLNQNPGDRPDAEHIAHLEAQLKTYEDFSEALAQGGAAVYRRNFTTGSFDFVSESIKSLTGYSAAEFTTDLWDRLVQHVELHGPYAHLDPDAALAKFRAGEIKTWRAEARFTNKAGETRWIMDLSTGIWDAQGQLTGSLGILHDISDLKSAVQREDALRKKLARAKRIESVGMLAGAVAHDLNNVLVPVIAYADLILSDCKENSDVHDYASQIEKAGKRAATVIQDLLALARRDIQEIRPVNMNSAVESFLHSDLYHELTAAQPEVHVQQELADPLPSALAPENALFKIIGNLIINAFEFMPEGGVVSVKTSTIDVAAATTERPGLEPGTYVELAIRDTGSALSETELDRVFEPFFTKKVLGRSTNGLGLAVVYGLVRDFGGHIYAEAELGRGNAFYVYFPTAERGAQPEEKAPANFNGTETLLVIDDEEAPRDVATRCLRRLGYTVHTASSGQDALDKLQSDLKDTHIDLLLLDMIMDEDCDGLETYRRIAKDRPSQKCIIVSGYSETDRVKEALSLGVGKFLRKPYTTETLRQAVRRELDRA